MWSQFPKLPSPGSNLELVVGLESLAGADIVPVYMTKVLENDKSTAAMTGTVFLL
jgi:hypothetical protein